MVTTHDQRRNMSRHVSLSISFLVYCLCCSLFDCRIINPAIGIQSESKIYLAQIKELDYTLDSVYQIYHHTDHVYQLMSLAADHDNQRIYFCSATTIYTLDVRPGAIAVPTFPVDDVPCQSNLIYVAQDSTLTWTYRRSVVQIDLTSLSREYLWNSTSMVLDMTYNGTLDDDTVVVYASITFTDRQSSVTYCRSDRRQRLVPFQKCHFIDSGYDEVTALAVQDNLLYVADRLQQRIYVLTLLSSDFVIKKVPLPLNTSTVADICSMIIYGNYLIWLTNSGHIRSVSLIDYQVRNIFWFDEPLHTLRLVSFVQWPNQTTTTYRPITTTTETTRTSKHSTSSIASITSSLTTRRTSSSLTSTTTTTTTEQHQTSTIHIDSNPWKATAYVTSIILGFALFICAAMITCVLLNYRLGKALPNSFINIFHILRNRTTVDGVLTLSMD
jgi:hypothetical protein